MTDVAGLLFSMEIGAGPETEKSWRLDSADPGSRSGSAIYSTDAWGKLLSLSESRLEERNYNKTYILCVVVSYSMR